MCVRFSAHWTQKKITCWLQQSRRIWLVPLKLIIYLLKNLLPESETYWYLIWNSCGKTLGPSPSSIEHSETLFPKQVHGTRVALACSRVSSFQGKLDSVNQDIWKSKMCQWKWTNFQESKCSKLNSSHGPLIFMFKSQQFCCSADTRNREHLKYKKKRVLLWDFQSNTADPVDWHPNVQVHIWTYVLGQKSTTFRVQVSPSLLYLFMEYWEQNVCFKLITWPLFWSQTM